MWNEKNVRSIRSAKKDMDRFRGGAEGFSAALRCGVRRRWGRMSRAEHEGGGNRPSSDVRAIVASV